MIILSKHLKQLLRRSSCFSLMDESSSHSCIVSCTLGCSGEQKWLCGISHEGSYPNETEFQFADTPKHTYPAPSDKVDLVDNEFDLAEIEKVLSNVIRESSPEYASLSPISEENDADTLPISNESTLISAMKGSRERRGKGVRNMSVTWAPDVYDPPPTPTIQYPRRSGRKPYKPKKSGKSKHKGRKGKQVPRKGSLATDYCFKVIDDSNDDEYEEVHLHNYCGGTRFCNTQCTRIRIETTEAAALPG